MTYAVKEMFPTLQGEGFHTGRRAVFVRFAGCNLWSGLERDRATAVCKFCDTDFVGIGGHDGGKYVDAHTLAEATEQIWERNFAGVDRFAVLTGGEPLLQLDSPLLDALHTRQFVVAIETNGTIPAPDGVDWICVSPKAGADLVQQSGHELKLVYPQPGAAPEAFEHLPFEHFFLQPMDGPEIDGNTRAVIEYCHAHPKWEVSIQSHKYLGLP